jgi:DNA-binding Lrp family transcriptional regulator
MKYSNQEFQSLKDSFIQLTVNYDLPISTTDCEDRIQKMLEKQIPNSFLMVINIKKQEVMWSSSVNKYIGYNEYQLKTRNEFAYDTIDAVHWERREQYLLFGFMLYQVSQIYKEWLNPFQQQYMIKIPIRKRNGNIYGLSKQVCLLSWIILFNEFKTAVSVAMYLKRLGWLQPI